MMRMRWSLSHPAFVQTRDHKQVHVPLFLDETKNISFCLIDIGHNSQVTITVQSISKTILTFFCFVYFDRFLTDNELSGDIPNNLLVMGAAM